MTRAGVEPAPARRALRRVQVAFGANTLGDAAGTIALPVFVLQTTGSLTRTGVLVAVATAGTLLSGVLVGPWVDRFGLQRAAEVALAVGSLLTAAIVVLHLLGSLSFTALLVISFLRAAADPPAEAAVSGLVGPLARAGGVPLERANGAVRLVRAVCDMVGPLVAGGGIVLLGAEVVLALDAAGGVVGLLVLLTRRLPVAVGEGSARPPGLAGAAVGLSVLRRDRTLTVLVLGSAAFAALDIGLVTVVLTDYAATVLGDPALFGLLISGFGCGSLLGTALYTAYGSRIPRRATYLTTYAVVAGVVLALAATPGPWGAAGLLLIAGTAVAPLDNLYLSVMQERVDGAVFGRVSTLVTTLVTAPATLSVPAVAALVVALGTAPALAALGVSYLALVAVTACLPALSDLDRTRVPVTPPGRP